MENLQSTSSATNLNQMETDDNSHKGYAVIFNNEKFHPSLRQIDRKETTNDVIKLKNVFKHFNIKVHVNQNFTLNRIQNEVKRLSKFNFTSYKCFIVVILSNGKENNILYAQDLPYNLNETIINPIANANSSLTGIAKIFIIQACRGSNILINNLIRAKAVPSIQIPTKSDMYLAFSMYEGFVSHGPNKTGGIFIQTFCEMIMKDDLTQSITTVMEQVTEKLVQENLNQVPMVLTTMSKPFRFGDIGREMTKKIEINNDKGSLPTKIIVEIFSYLSLGDLKDASRVCKKWNSAFKHSKTQDKLVLFVNERNITEFLGNFKQRNFHNVHFDWLKFMSYTENMKFWEELMPNLEFLSFYGCEINENQLLSMTKNLKTLKLHDCESYAMPVSKILSNKNWKLNRIFTNIKHFEFSFLDKKNSDCFYKLLKLMQNLEILLVHKQPAYQLPKYSQKSNNFYKYLESNALSLKSLELCGFNLNEIENIVKINDLKLEKLILQDHLHSVLLNKIIKFQPSIRHLHVAEELIDNNDLITIYKNLPKLKYLNIGNCYNIDADGIKELWELKQLKSLSLCNCVKMIIGEFTKETNDNLQTLKLWGLKSCENLLMQITNKFVNLRELELKCPSGITEEEIQNMWRKLRWLKKLVIECDEVITDFAYTGESIQKEAEINGCSIAKVKSLEHLDLRFKSNITISSLQEIAKLKGLVYFHADFSCSQIEIKDLNILISCKSLETIDIQLSEKCIRHEDKYFLKDQFHRIKLFQIKNEVFTFSNE